MKQPTYEEYLANPSAVRARVERHARRQRAEAVHRFIVAPLKQIFKRDARRSAQSLRARTA